MPFSEVITTLQSVSKSVATLAGEVKTLQWTMPLIVTIGIAVIGIIVALK